MDQDRVTLPDPARCKARGERADAVVEFAVAPCARRRVERRPDQEWMLRARLAPHPQQPRHVEPRERADHPRRLCLLHASSRAALAVIAGLDPTSIIFDRLFEDGWMRRSSPRMTAPAYCARVPHWQHRNLFVRTHAKFDATATGRDPTRP